MADGTQSFVDMLRKFGSDLGLPKIDVDKLIETHRENIETFEQSASAISQGARSIAEKNREIFETALREATTMARDFRPLATSADVAEKQTEYSRKVFDYMAKNTREIAELADQSNKEASRIFQERLKALFGEIGAGRDKM
jgi:phasin family protein